MTSFCQCRLCDGPASSWREKLVPVETFPDGPRYGSYLRCVPVQNRIGDYVHCTGRVVNIILKRLMQHFPDPRQSGPIKDIIHLLTIQAQGIPLPERLAPRHTKIGSLDLTASTLFVQNVEVHARIGACLRALHQTIPFGNGHLNLGAAIELLFRTLHGLHTFWRQKTHSPHLTISYTTFYPPALANSGMPQVGRFPPGFTRLCVTLPLWWICTIPFTFFRPFPLNVGM